MQRKYWGSNRVIILFKGWKKINKLELEKNNHFFQSL